MNASEARLGMVLALMLVLVPIINGCAGLSKPLQPTGVVRAINHEAKAITLVPAGDKVGTEPLLVHWYPRTEFIRDGKHVPPESLTPGTAVTIYYRQPITAGRLVSKIVWEAPEPR